MMAIDSVSKRKSVVAIGLMVVGPVVVPDGTLATFDRQVIGYGYGGIAASTPSDTTAGTVCIRNASLLIASATTTIDIASATTTLNIAPATTTIEC